MGAYAGKYPIIFASWISDSIGFFFIDLRVGLKTRTSLIENDFIKFRLLSILLLSSVLALFQSIMKENTIEYLIEPLNRQNEKIDQQKMQLETFQAIGHTGLPGVTNGLKGFSLLLCWPRVSTALARYF